PAARGTLGRRSCRGGLRAVERREEAPAQEVGARQGARDRTAAQAGPRRTAQGRGGELRQQALPAEPARRSPVPRKAGPRAGNGENPGASRSGPAASAVRTVPRRTGRNRIGLERNRRERI